MEQLKAWNYWLKEKWIVIHRAENNQKMKLKSENKLKNKESNETRNSR